MLFHWTTFPLSYRAEDSTHKTYFSMSIDLAGPQLLSKDPRYAVKEVHVGHVHQDPDAHWHQDPDAHRQSQGMQKLARAWPRLAKELPKACQSLPKGCQELAKGLPRAAKGFTKSCKNGKKDSYKWKIGAGLV